MCVCALELSSLLGKHSYKSASPVNGRAEGEGGKAALSQIWDMAKPFMDPSAEKPYQYSLETYVVGSGVEIDFATRVSGSKEGLK